MSKMCTGFTPFVTLVLLVLIGQLGGCSTPRQVSQVPSVNDESTPTSSKVIHVARSMIGMPYHYGGNTPEQGFDCSGLVYYSHIQAGIQLPRTSFGQYKATQPVSRTGLRPGDLVFFRLNRRKISHVGIYLGKNRFVHAPSSGKEVTIDELTDPYWQRRFVRGGRPL